MCAVAELYQNGDSRSCNSSPYCPAKQPAALLTSEILAHHVPVICDADAVGVWVALTQRQRHARAPAATVRQEASATAIQAAPVCVKPAALARLEVSSHAGTRRKHVLCLVDMLEGAWALLCEPKVPEGGGRAKR